MTLSKLKVANLPLSLSISTAVLSLFMVTACSQQQSHDFEGGETDELLVGMCFDNASEEDTFIDENNKIVAKNFEIIDCKFPHDNEVYYKFNLPEEKEYIETNSLLNSMLGVCEDKFEGYIGRSYQKSFYEMSILTPTVESWKTGDREVVCYAFHPQDEKLTRSLRSIKQ